MDISKIDFYEKNNPCTIDEINKLESEEGFIEVEEYSKGYIAIWDNNGPDVLLMKQDKDTQEILITDVGYMNANDPNGKIPNFNISVEAGCPEPQEFEGFIDFI